MREKLIEAVERAVRNVVFQTGGKNGMVWQIVSMWSGPDSSDEILFVGRELREGESLKDPPADMLCEMRRCKAMIAAKATLKAIEEPSDDNWMEDAAEAQSDAIEAAREAYNKRHQYRRDRGDDVPKYASCPAEWLPAVRKAIFASILKELGDG